jgi:4-diphosphocytidyl-2-C-methyl-D-erythritol kinase
MTAIRAIAPAKLNLGLEIVGRRPDGYREIATVFQTIDLIDTITVYPSSKLRLEIDNPGLRTDENLAIRAAKTLQQRFSIRTGATIRIEKQIPVAAGLGGASSDAAATLRALSLMWGIQVSTSELHEIATELGSDVPFFLYGGTALGQGRGEIIRPLGTQLSAWVIVAAPDDVVQNKTAMMFRALAKRDFSSGSAVREIASQIESNELPEAFPNAFARHASVLWPQLSDLSTQFKASGAKGISLSGAGPSLFSVVQDEDAAVTISERLRARCSLEARVYVCRTLSHIPPLVRDNM